MYNNPATYSQQKAPLSELYVAGHWKMITSDEDAGNITPIEPASGATKESSFHDEKKKLALEKKILAQAQAQQKEVKRLQTKAA